MPSAVRLEAYLHDAARGIAGGDDLARVILAVAEAGCRIAALLAAGPLAGDLAATREERDGGDAQKELDLRADGLLQDALRGAPVAVLASEETEAPVALAEGAPFAVALDPLDGSSNIATNVPVGTIFSVLPAVPGGDPAAAFLQPGSRQVAAGFLIYGPHTALVLTLHAGTRCFVLDPASGGFVLHGEQARIPVRTREYAINAANARHWDPAVSGYVSELLRGAEGPRGADFNTRWVASLVADAYRILGRGGVYLYPADRRRGYERGRLRLVYEANPVALLVEQAGGAATDGCRRILDLVPRGVHERTPLVFGSHGEIARVASHGLDAGLRVGPGAGSRLEMPACR